MCGIAGVYQRGEDGSRPKEAVLRMNDHQSLRGPDDGGIFCAEGIALGHRRLSILDLTNAGHQPMADMGGRYHITFNGEIYNFRELRGDLEKSGHIFRTQTDTEVILAAYKEWGVDSFVRFRGMFAFGLWDNEKQELYLVRDHYGIKPLYYYAKQGMAVFASTVGALEKSGLVPLEKNSDAIIGFLLFGSVPQPLTTLEDVFALPAGHYLRIDRSGEKLLKYYDPIGAFLEKKDVSFEDAASRVNALLKDSVRHHLISDVEPGVFLSGGLDSSALAALAFERTKELHLKFITTLSVYFNEDQFSEREYQKKFAEEYLKTDHRETLVTKASFFRGIPDIFAAMDQPTIDGANTYVVSLSAKSHGVKVALSGLGSDEIFMGYSTFRRARFLRFLQKCPGIVPRILSLLGGRYKKLSHLAFRDPLHFYLAYRGLRTAKEVAGILGIRERVVHECVGRIAMAQDFPREISKLDPRDFVSYLELKEYLQNQLLKDTDFMSMAHSIEVRVPFLDRPLVEYASSLPVRVKMHGVENKSLLVAAMRGVLPEEIFSRPKMGFTFPFEKWLRSAEGERLLGDDKLSNSVSKDTHWSKFWSIHVARKSGLL
jgi:asparagine synthase (glutamine-hydrolysing)